MATDFPQDSNGGTPGHAEPVEQIPPSEEHAAPSIEDRQQLYGLLSGYRVSQAMYVVAKLGIPDLLADGPRSIDELAAATSTHAGNLYRVLRLLAGIGLFDEKMPNRFTLTSLGSGLRSDIPGSIHASVLMLLDEHMWRPWGELLHSVRTGETAFDHIHGMRLFEYLRRHPAAAAIFNQAMTSSAARSGTAITQGYDFSGIDLLVDVGGGHGLLLATVLQAYPETRGILFDRPEVVVGASAGLQAAGVPDRCEIVAGDFFASVPPGGDAYILRQIIHDWDDAQATHILKNCRRSMHDKSRLLVVERRVGDDYREALPALYLDLEMLVTLGGAERTDQEYRALFAAADFQLTTITPLNDAAQFSVFEGMPI